MPADQPSARVLAYRVAVGVRVREAREWANLTQEGLAHAAGLSRDTIVRVELGTRTARLDWLVQIADALDVPPASLLPD
ncbi:helix-turn-helix domain-containing protein [Streptomyces lonarensis]|uniref:Helix-turn-helix transcriptional regulator n=1 Tax=Streptomyces lonarensis TaxID=700599 RepID=A0A7X6CXB4_9ACTN|nr:helix-turn-helix transcriptional regulator [Streptomyces lonarensis]NJQ04311.1 helix-turn-helix transcriptional regulator [Streptomyces lonarensis]